ncbi:transposase, partial [Klebsiella michiganensis]|uniref:integrase core domain-containing protein n=1 Tax=Klebsiella michiganensis TaxID=1134687 RepID=UPI002DBDAE0C
SVITTNIIRTARWDIARHGNIYAGSYRNRKREKASGYIGSNPRFRDECLNEHWFSDIVHARKIINDWRQDYNECRPHSALNYQT